MSYIEGNSPQLYNDVCQIIDGTRSRLAITVNAEVCLLHWHIGSRIKNEILENKRADYGKEIIKKLSALLTEKYGKGWGLAKLQHCVRGAYTFSEDEIQYAVRTQLTWTHLRSLYAFCFSSFAICNTITKNTGKRIGITAYLKIVDD